jgi:hypothetical protein
MEGHGTVSMIQVQIRPHSYEHPNNHVTLLDINQTKLHSYHGGNGMPILLYSNHQLLIIKCHYTKLQNYSVTL